jgi:YidC/Oxa1 family membrane protein insertase
MTISDMGFGMGTGIIACSILMRGVWSPFILYNQICSIKLRLLEPETESYQQTMKRLYKTGDRALIAHANEDYTRLKRSYGIWTGLQLLPMTQLPFVILFFWSLQELTYSFELFPSMMTDGFLWFSNLTEPDPYYILPLMLATSSFISIHVRLYSEKSSVFSDYRANCQVLEVL